MKKSVILAVMPATLVLSCYKKPTGEFPPPFPVQKFITFNISQGSDYTPPAYDGVEAELRLSVARMRHSDGQIFVLWDSVVDFRSLRDYPAHTAPEQVVRRIDGIVDDRETVLISYAIRYRDAEQRLSQRARNEFVPAGLASLTLPVRL